jgi:hypothetical protein
VGVEQADCLDSTDLPHQARARRRGRGALLFVDEELADVGALDAVTVGRHAAVGEETAQRPGGVGVVPARSTVKDW